MTATEISNEVRVWLDARDWNYDEKITDEKDSVLFFTHIAAEDGLFKGYATTIVCRDGRIQAVFVPPVTVPKKFFPEVSEYFGRINTEYVVGKWLLDYEDGEPRWEFVKEVETLKPGAEDLMDDLIGFSRMICDKYAEGIVKIIIGNAKPEELVHDDDEEEDHGSDEPKSAAKSRGKKRGKQRKTEDSERLDAPANELPRNYSIQGLNVEGKVPLEEIVEAVKCFREGKWDIDVDAPRLNILLSGVPGSGKTAFAKYLANEIGAPLHTVKASDILSRFVGETERRIAKVFAAASKHNEILFFDEIDSLLADRRGAEHSWEMSQTNALLQELEAYSGIMIGATNLLGRLDAAVMRRFTYKLRLSYLNDEGKALFFQRYFKTQLTAEQQRRLNSIDRLTPGDFRTVKESLYYLKDKQNNEARLDALETESASKGRSRAKIGFC